MAVDSGSSESGVPREGVSGSVGGFGRLVDYCDVNGIGVFAAGIEVGVPPSAT